MLGFGSVESGFVGLAPAVKRSQGNGLARRCRLGQGRVMMSKAHQQTSDNGAQKPEVKLPLFPKKVDLVLAALCAGELSLGSAVLILPPSLAGHTSWFSQFSLDVNGGVTGLAFTVPLLVLGLGLSKVPLPFFQDLTELTRRAVDEVLGNSSVVELFLFACAAGIGEELLFRSIILDTVNYATNSQSIGLAISSLLFGLTHFASPAYAVLSGLAGVFFGWEFLVSSNNVLAPILTHALYDFVFAIIVIREYNR
mmetsp:Transcript_970/g.2452  ORF Transcript_970/g.2452 Transcript_970/m.2452 type:complete len:253 (-) Transcript_970:171-929(-)|eukprot:CAMPEP_0113966470 /NCGR_PEP_ID=MMETSP0011_2-20120614/8345_1 /TAXON_ID=101924 /ORGANISM="Rhodosorus marinus" /LENGTH=252 /DNA_ID=CAMNT_0000979151 /DNA_START=144 /DNA_END=902 /DNA_ORIENTATION=- /assembly_acc=CAM_ASM_000156